MMYWHKHSDGSMTRKLVEDWTDEEKALDLRHKEFLKEAEALGYVVHVDTSTLRWVAVPNMTDNIPINNPARDRAWEAFIKRKDVRSLFNNDEGFNFPLSREYYDLWCLCWAKAWDAGFYDGYKAGEENAKAYQQTQIKEKNNG